MVIGSAGVATKIADGYFSTAQIMNHGGDLRLSVKFRLKLFNRYFSLFYHVFILSTNELQRRQLLWKKTNVLTSHSKEEFARASIILRANCIPMRLVHSSKPTLCANSFLSFSAFDNSVLSVSFLFCNSSFSFSRCFESSCCLRSVLRSSERKELKSLTC